MKKISSKEFEKFFGSFNDKQLINEIKKDNLKYRFLNYIEKKKIINFIKRNHKHIKNKKAGVRYKNIWENGWKENLILYKKKKSISSLLPKYFGKNNYARIGTKLIKVNNSKFEPKILKHLMSYIFKKYLKNFRTIVEFGCGTGHHLLNLKKYNKKSTIYGLDWAKSSQQIINSFTKKNIIGKNFNFFKPKIDFALEKNGWASYTVASLEQVGNKYIPFVNFLIKKKPKIVIHIEPIVELHEHNNELEQLSIQYIKKRNYLNGYLNYLKNLEKKKIIKIIKTRRSYFGSLFINGYSLIIWKILN